MNSNGKPNIGLTRAISIIYFILGLVIVIAVLNEVQINGIILNWKYDLWGPIIIMIVALGTIRRTKWGRWFSYILSMIILIGVPIGTIIGGFMLWHLTKYRASFTRWY